MILRKTFIAAVTSAALVILGASSGIAKSSRGQSAQTLPEGAPHLVFMGVTKRGHDGNVCNISARLWHVPTNTMHFQNIEGLAGTLKNTKAAGHLTPNARAATLEQLENALQKVRAAHGRAHDCVLRLPVFARG